MTVLSYQRLPKAVLLALSIGTGMSLATSVYADTNSAAATKNRPQTIAPATKLAIAKASATGAVTPTSNTDTTSQDGIIAMVDDAVILKSELADAIDQTKRRATASGKSLPNAQKLQSDVLNALILRKLQLSLINRIGLRPDANTINQRLAQIAKAEGLDSLSKLQQHLDKTKPGSYAKLRQKIIEDSAILALQQRQIASRVRITDQDIDAFLASPEAQRLNQSEYRTLHIRVPYVEDYSRLSAAQRDIALQVANQIATALAQPKTDVATAIESAQVDYPIELQGGDMGYHKATALPNQLAGVITALEVGEVSDPIITPKGIDIVKLVDKRSHDRLIVPQWHARHILIKVDERHSDELAQQKINDLYDQLRRGANFANLAATYSDDLASAGRGGDLDWVAENTMVAPFEEMMKRTPIGDFSTPFKTQFGWHILKVDGKRDQDISDQYRRRLAREALYQRMAPQAQEDWLQELQSSAYIKTFGY